MDTLEKFDIHKETNLDNQINDRNIVKRNILFDTIIQTKTGRGHPAQTTLHEKSYIPSVVIQQSFIHSFSIHPFTGVT